MELRHKFDLKMLLNHSNMARSSFYYYQKQSKLPDKYHCCPIKVNKKEAKLMAS